MSEKLIFETAQEAQAVGARAMMILTDRDRVVTNAGSMAEINHLATLLYQFSSHCMLSAVSNETATKIATIGFLSDVQTTIRQAIPNASDNDAPYQVRGCLEEIDLCLARLEGHKVAAPRNKSAALSVAGLG